MFFDFGKTFNDCVRYPVYSYDGTNDGRILSAFTNLNDVENFIRKELYRRIEFYFVNLTNCRVVNIRETDVQTEDYKLEAHLVYNRKDYETNYAITIILEIQIIKLQ